MSVRITEDGGVLSATLTRPALDLEVGAGFAEAVKRIGPETRCFLLLGEGPNFCFGGDVRGFAAAEDLPAHIRLLAESMHAQLEVLRTSGVPVVVGVRGWAAGAGMALVLLGDIVVLGESAKLRTAYTGIAVTPDCGMTWTLPRAVGAARAREILFTNRVVAAQEALSIGIASRVVPDAEVEATAAAVALEIAAGPAGALRATRRLLDDGADRSFSEHLAYEAESIAAHAGNPEGREGIAAFLEKRPPRFAPGAL